MNNLTPLQRINRDADRLFHIYNASYAMWELGYSTKHDVDKHYAIYIRAEAHRQLFRKQNGLPYLLTKEMQDILREEG